MTRVEEREWLVKLAYQTQGKTDESPELLLDQHEISPQTEYLIDSLTSFLAHLDEIDEAIERNLTAWPFSRLLRLDLAIMRIGCNELLFTKAAPERVVINECVEIAKKYSDERSYRLINGVLAGIAKSHAAD